MGLSAASILSELTTMTPRYTNEAPKGLRGVYGLVNHNGVLSYIGSTRAQNEDFYKRIHGRHRTGSEGMSHYFAHMYNTGRMWRDRTDPLTKADGDIAKALRNEFIIDHCRAVWLPLPDTTDIARLEAEVIALAPDHAIAWKRRRMQSYDEPVDQVEATLKRLEWGARELEAIERQRARFFAASASVATSPVCKHTNISNISIAPFPDGPFRFFALDVETANNERSSICQIGVACVRPDNSIATWVTYVDPKVDRWVFTYLHGISPNTVQGAPHFAEVLPVLRDALAHAPVYQHSGFDSSAIVAACNKNDIPVPAWNWRNSVQVARAAWPELRGYGGHGLANLKEHLGLVFEHHDAGEDARAAAEVVLCAEGLQPVRNYSALLVGGNRNQGGKNPDLSEESDSVTIIASGVEKLPVSSGFTNSKLIGRSQISQGNIDNNHIYLRNFFDKFPLDAVGGSNRALAAKREVSIDWGGPNLVMTDLDGAKRLFRKRGWIKEFFEKYGARAGDMVTVEELAPYCYRVNLRDHRS